MKTTIGINIITKTAKEQDQLVNLRESRAYYEESYNSSVKPHAKKIIEKFTNCNWEITSNTAYQKNGEVSNAIIFVFYNQKGLPKNEIRKELERYIKRKFNRLFKQ